MIKNLETPAKILLVVLLIYCPFFLHLGDLPIRIWDEARLVANALEMQKDGDYIVTHYNGQPDMWNTKPPLMIWSQVFFINLMGNQEIAFRMPSAVAGMLTCLLILLISWRYLKSYWFGLIAIMILITTNGYIGDHVVRTGDYDAMLTLFTTLSSLSLFLWAENGKSKFIHWFFIGLLLGVLTKSIQALMFLPAIGLYLLFTRQLISLLKNKWLYIDLLAFMLIVAAYYLARESANSGYLEAVRLNELGGRFLTTIENHKHGFSYYLNLQYHEQFTTWIIFFFTGIFFAFTFPTGAFRRLTIFSSLLSVVYLLLISLSSTKLAWYTAPLYPLLAIVSAMGIYRLYLLVTEIHSGVITKQSAQVFGVLMLLMFFFFPYYNTIDKVYKPREASVGAEYNTLSHYLQETVKGKHNLDGFKVCHDGYTGHLEYYVNKLNSMGVKITFNDPLSLQTGDKVIFNWESVLKTIESHYDFTVLDSYYNVKVIRIDGPKTNRTGSITENLLSAPGTTK